MKSLILFCFAALLLCSCQTVPPQKTVAVSMFSMNNQFAKNLCYSFRREMSQRGYQVVFRDANGDSGAQLSQIKGLIGDKVDLLCIMPVDSQNIDPAVLEANAANIPVFTFDTGCDNSNKGKVVCHIATDNDAAGRSAAQLMVRALNDKGNVLIVGAGSMLAVKQRAQGFRDELKNRNSAIKVVDEVPGSYDAIVTSRAVFEALKKNPDISGIYALTDVAARGAMRGVTLLTSENDVKVIGFGDVSFIEQSIRSGKMYGGIGQSHVKLSRQATEMISGYLEDPASIAGGTCYMLAGDSITADKLSPVEEK